jgi:hypothetical protein
MSRTGLDGKQIRPCLEWLANRTLNDQDIAGILGMPPTTFSGHKDKPEFPSFAEIKKLATALELSATVLQIWFGDRDIIEVQLLNDDELRQFLMLGGANHAVEPLSVLWHGRPLGAPDYTVVNDDDGL